MYTFDEFFDKFFDEIFWQIFWWVSYLLTIASFRIGVPSILFWMGGCVSKNLNYETWKKEVWPILSSYSLLLWEIWLHTNSKKLELIERPSLTNNFNKFLCSDSWQQNYFHGALEKYVFACLDLIFSFWLWNNCQKCKKSTIFEPSVILF